jgi:hypothetical protein
MMTQITSTRPRPPPPNAGPAIVIAAAAEDKQHNDDKGDRVHGGAGDLDELYIGIETSG